MMMPAPAEQKPTAYSDADAGKHVGDEAAVTGKIASITKSGKGTVFVNFGDKFPRQTFSGVVFAKDVDAVGDLSAFDGKTVTLTGKIEASPDGKPQIVIRSASQLKLADEPAPAAPAAPNAPPVPAMPPTAPMPATPPAVAAVPTTPAIPAPAIPAPATPTPAPKPEETKRIVLAENWSAAPQTGDMTRKDLAIIFGDQISSSGETPSNDSIEVYPQVPFLTPLPVARKTLNLERTNPSRTKITTPGLPAASLTANTFPGIFPGGFTSMTLVTDSAEQVVSVHLVDDNPRIRTAEMTDTGGFHTYNFITQRTKSAGQLVIKHEVLREGAPSGVVVVDSQLIDPLAADPNAPPRIGSRNTTRTAIQRPKTGKVLERSRWYVPKPLVNAILRASGNR